MGFEAEELLIFWDLHYRYKISQNVHLPFSLELYHFGAKPCVVAIRLRYLIK